MARAPQDELDLDKALELVESVSPDQRVTENKTQIKAALATIKSVKTLAVYSDELDKIANALTKLTRHAAKHEGLAEAVSKIAKQIDDLVAAMQARRKRQRKEEEELMMILNLDRGTFLQ